MKNAVFLTIFLLTWFAKAQNLVFFGEFTSKANYYINDSKTGEFIEKYRLRSNNYLNLMGKWKSFTFGFQLESYAPKALLNYSPNLDKNLGIATYFANYKSEKIDVTAGYFYEQFGSGLILRSWEDRALGFNNAFKGLKINFTPIPSIKIAALGGKQRVGFSTSKGTILGFDTEIELAKYLNIDKSNLTIGFSAVNRSQPIESISKLSKSTQAYSYRANYSSAHFFSNIEYILKSKDALFEFGNLNTNALFKGNALLLNLGYTSLGFGTNATLRRLENMNFYSEREATNNIDNELIINYLPSLTKQHNYSLANIYVYQSQTGISFNPFQKFGEIGLQFDIYYKLKKNTFFGGKNGADVALNFSSIYGLDASYSLDKLTYNSKYFGFGKKYFTDYNIEFRKKISDKLKTVFTYINQFYNTEYIEERSGKVNASIGVAAFTYNYLPSKSLKFEIQHLWTQDDRNNWIGGKAEFFVTSTLALFVSDTYNYETTLQKIHYYNFGGSYSKNQTRISLNYGRARGGLQCFGGICRFVPEATGIGLNILTLF